MVVNHTPFLRHAAAMAKKRYYVVSDEFLPPDLANHVTPVLASIRILEKNEADEHRSQHSAFEPNYTSLGVMQFVRLCPSSCQPVPIT